MAAHGLNAAPRLRLSNCQLVDGSKFQDSSPCHDRSSSVAKGVVGVGCLRLHGVRFWEKRWELDAEKEVEML